MKAVAASLMLLLGLLAGCGAPAGERAYCDGDTSTIAPGPTEGGGHIALERDSCCEYLERPGGANHLNEWSATRRPNELFAIRSCVFPGRLVLQQGEVLSVSIMSHHPIVVEPWGIPGNATRAWDERQDGARFHTIGEPDWTRPYGDGGELLTWNFTMAQPGHYQVWCTAHTRTGPDGELRGMFMRGGLYVE